MATLHSELLPATKNDLSNRKRRYKITFKKKIETIGITRNKRNIISTYTEIARNNFIINSNIIQINDTKITDDSSNNNVNISELIRYCKNNPESFIILECNYEMVVRGFHFQLKLKFLVNNFTEIPMAQLTRPKLEKVLSETFYNKNVIIYDILWSQHFTGVIICGFIFDPVQACQYLMQCIKYDLDFYKKLRKDITNIFQKRLVNKTVDQAFKDSDANFEWNISQINAFTASFDSKNGGIGSNISILQKIWATHKANIFNKKINTKNSKFVVKELVKISMGCYVAWLYRHESFDSGRNVNTYHFQQELWAQLITNWMYIKYYHTILQKGALEYNDFKENYFIYLKEFCNSIDTNSEIDNINFVVFGYLKENIYKIIPKHIIQLIEEYFCDVSIHISLQNYNFFFFFHDKLT
eukprot:36275_1